jgi:hypothetical protein
MINKQSRYEADHSNDEHKQVIGYPSRIITDDNHEAQE